MKTNNNFCAGFTLSAKNKVIDLYFQGIIPIIVKLEITKMIV